MEMSFVSDRTVSVGERMGEGFKQNEDSSSFQQLEVDGSCGSNVKPLQGIGEAGA